MTQLNSQAVSAAALLRAIEAMPEARTKELAAASDRHPNHIARDLGRLEAAGLITTDPRALTDEGRAQLAMIGRAEHGGDPAQAASDRVASDSDKNGRVRGHWPIDKIRPNPANRPVDPATIPGLADSIEAAGEVLQPALLTPPDASGVRMLLAGERRWSALRLLQQRGTEDEDLWGRGLPFIEKEADKPTALLITLIENGQREDLSPWEDAQQLKALQDATDWSAREIAKKTGRSPEGSDTGVRDVQQKIKVAREATPEAIAEYERTRSWDQLRDSVTKPKAPPAPGNPRMALMIAEAAQVSERLHGVWDGQIPLSPKNSWIAADNEWWTFDGFGTFTLKLRACDWLAAQDFEEDAERVIMRLQSDAGVPHVLPGVTTDDPAANPPPLTGEGDRAAVEGADAAQAPDDATASPPAFSDEFIAEMLERHGREGDRAVNVCGLTTPSGEIWPGQDEPTEHLKSPSDRPGAEITLWKSSHERWGFALSTRGKDHSYQGDATGVFTNDAVFESRRAALLHAADRIRRQLGDHVNRKIEAWLAELVTGEAATAPEPARPASGGSRGSAPVPGSEVASRALAELARWEKDAPKADRHTVFARIDRLSAWSDATFHQLKASGLIRICQVALGADGTATFAALSPAAREWLATRGTGYVAAVHNTTVWKTPWIARVARAPAEPEPQPEPEAPSPGADRPADVRKQAAEALRFLHQRWTNFDMVDGETGREEFAEAAEAVNTPLPWRIDAEGGIVAANDRCVVGGRAEHDPDSPSRTRMRMVVLAVNAMAGLLTPPDDEDDEHEASHRKDVPRPHGGRNPTPAVPIEESVNPDWIACLEDGRRFKSLKRHLRTRYDLSPEQYRQRWGLPDDYPMVAPNYAKARADLAASMGASAGEGGQ